MRINNIYFVCFVALLITGCDNDPYKRKLQSTTLTPGEIQALGEGLPSEDEKLLRRWADRIARGETQGGEPPAHSVRDAIKHQIDYERLIADEEARKKRESEEANNKEEERRKRERQQLELIAEQRQAVHDEIAKRFDGRILSYAPQARFDQYGRPTSQFFTFNLKFRNRTNARVIGIAGYINLRDAFGHDLGSYPFRFEPQVEPGQIIDWSAHLPYDPKNSNHRAIKESSNLFYTWFFESIAFQDGTRIDRETISRGETNQTHQAPSKGSV
jgi:hypothetical protein